MTNTTVQCGGCSTDITITDEAFRTAAIAPCPECGEGADLRHARRHGDDAHTEPVSLDKRTPHFHVGANVPGYLPESDVFCTDSLDAAIESLRHELKDQQDDYDGNCEGSHAEVESGDCPCDWCSVWGDVEATLSAIADGDAQYRLKRDGDVAFLFCPPEGPDIRHWVTEIPRDRTTCDLNPDSDTYVGE